MKILSFSQIGKRSNNEDYKGENARLWMVCDGVGGHVSGERASKFVVDKMLELYNEVNPELNKTSIENSLILVQNELNAVLDKEPELEKMGTTFTGVFKTGAYWYAAHIGDSRIYLFRPAEQKLWHTWDHSLVGELVKNHSITREDGRFHPMSNRISKAIIANFEGKVQTPDIVKIDELRVGDCFLLCSDGVVEAWGDHELVELFGNAQMTFDEKFAKLQQQCAQSSKDNNTALLIEIEDEDAFSFGNGQNEELKWISFQDIRDDYQEYLKNQNEEEPVDVTLDEEGDAEPVAKEQEVAQPMSDEPLINEEKNGKNISMHGVQKTSSKCSGLKSGLVKYIVGVLLLFVGIGIGVYWEKNKGEDPVKQKTEQKAVNRSSKKTEGNNKKTNKQKESPQDSKVTSDTTKTELVELLSKIRKTK